MPKYRVLVTMDATVSQVVEVDAIDAEDACYEAEKWADNHHDRFVLDELSSEDSPFADIDDVEKTG